MKIYTVERRLHCMTRHRITVGYYSKKSDARAHVKRLNKSDEAVTNIQPFAKLDSIKVKT